MHSCAAHVVSKSRWISRNCGGVVDGNGAVFQRRLLSGRTGRRESLERAVDLSHLKKCESAFSRLVLTVDSRVDAIVAAIAFAVPRDRQGRVSSLT